MELNQLPGQVENPNFSLYPLSSTYGIAKVEYFSGDMPDIFG